MTLLISQRPSLLSPIRPQFPGPWPQSVPDTVLRPRVPLLNAPRSVSPRWLLGPHTAPGLSKERASSNVSCRGSMKGALRIFLEFCKNDFELEFWNRRVIQDMKFCNSEHLGLLVQAWCAWDRTQSTHRADTATPNYVCFMRPDPSDRSTKIGPAISFCHLQCQICLV